MARMAGKVKREFDAAAAITLRKGSDAAETADAAEASVDLNVLNEAYWDNNEQPNGIFIVSIDVTEATFADSNEVYDLYIEVDTAANDFGASTHKEVARLKSVPSTGYYEIPVSSQLIEALLTNADKIRIRLDLTGDGDESFNYAAWMTFLAA